MSGTTGFLGTWSRVWFRPEPTSTLALVRIAYGLLVTAWALSMAPDLAAFYSSSGVLGPGGASAPRWEPAVVGLYVLLVAAAICVTVGYGTRVAAVVVFVAVTWFQRRNPFVLNAGDRLLANLGFYLVLAPAGASLSLDRWRRAPGAFWVFPARAPWALRLVQIQVSVLYLSTVWEKLQGHTWADGTAVSYALGITQLSRVPVPGQLTDWVAFTHLLTWATLAIELGLALLVWSRRLRPWVLGAGVALHLSIEVTMTVGFLGPALFVAYLAFVPADTMSAALQRVGSRGRRRLGWRTEGQLALPCDAQTGLPNTAVGAAGST